MIGRFWRLVTRGARCESNEVQQKQSAQAARNRIVRIGFLAFASRGHSCNYGSIPERLQQRDGE